MRVNKRVNKLDNHNNMKRIFFLLFTAALLASCSSTFNIQGTSDVQNLDGRMLYLKAVKGDQLKNIDSCDVVHGQFTFKGTLDTVKVGTLYIDDENIMPIVLEDGEIVIQFNTAKQTCTGTPLNDSLAAFIERYNRISNQIADLGHQQSRAIMDGEDMDVVNHKLSQKAAMLDQECDKIVTTFIEENFDNILGPYVFQMVTSAMEIPLTNAWIDALMTKATPKFKNDPYVKEFMQAAERNQAIMTGMEEPTSAPVPDNNEQVAPPTPNQMAEPGK